MVPSRWEARLLTYRLEGKSLDGPIFFEQRGEHPHGSFRFGQARQLDHLGRIAAVDGAVESLTSIHSRRARQG